MFKIGNSKELPAIPDHLSDEGKNFVRQCLQRNPHHRPTAAQLLDHPFVRNVAPIERAILSPGAGESVSPVLQPVRSITSVLFILWQCYLSCATIMSHILYSVIFTCIWNLRYTYEHVHNN